MQRRLDFTRVCFDKVHKSSERSGDSPLGLRGGRNPGDLGRGVEGGSHFEAKKQISADASKNRGSIARTGRGKG